MCCQNGKRSGTCSRRAAGRNHHHWPWGVRIIKTGDGVWGMISQVPRCTLIPTTYVSCLKSLAKDLQNDIENRLTESEKLNVLSSLRMNSSWQSRPTKKWQTRSNQQIHPKFMPRNFPSTFNIKLSSEPLWWNHLHGPSLRWRACWRFFPVKKWGTFVQW